MCHVELLKCAYKLQCISAELKLVHYWTFLRLFRSFRQLFSIPAERRNSMVGQRICWKINVRNLIVFDRIYEICLFCPTKGLLRRNTNEIPYSRNLRGRALFAIAHISIDNFLKKTSAFLRLYCSPAETTLRDKLNRAYASFRVICLGECNTHHFGCYVFASAKFEITSINSNPAF